MKIELSSNSVFLHSRFFVGRRAASLVFVLLWSLAVGRAPAATVTWTGAASVYWTNSANWSPPQVPTIADTAVINSGNVTFAANSTFGTLNFNGGLIAGPVVVESNRVMNWNGGRLAQGSSLTVLSNGLVNLAGSAQKDLGGPMTNFGRVVLSGSGFYLLDDNNTWQGSVTNLGVWEMQGDLSIGNYFGNLATVFGNWGTLRKTVGSGAGVLGWC